MVTLLAMRALAVIAAAATRRRKGGRESILVNPDMGNLVVVVVMPLLSRGKKRGSGLMHRLGCLLHRALRRDRLWRMGVPMVSTEVPVSDDDDGGDVAPVRVVKRMRTMDGRERGEVRAGRLTLEGCPPDVVQTQRSLRRKKTKMMGEKTCWRSSDCGRSSFLCRLACGKMRCVWGMMTTAVTLSAGES